MECVRDINFPKGENLQRNADAGTGGEFHRDFRKNPGHMSRNQIKTQLQNSTIMKKATINWILNHAAQFEEDRFAAMTIMLTFQSCLGSLAAYYALQSDAVFSLYLCAMVTMAANAAFLAQASAKYCLAIFYASVLTNLALIAVNFV